MSIDFMFDKTVQVLNQGFGTVKLYPADPSHLNVDPPENTSKYEMRKYGKNFDNASDNMISKLGRPIVQTKQCFGCLKP